MSWESTEENEFLKKVYSWRKWEETINKNKKIEMEAKTSSTF
jgi:hypothetical protein